MLPAAGEIERVKVAPLFKSPHCDRDSGDTRQRQNESRALRRVAQHIGGLPEPY